MTLEAAADPGAHCTLSRQFTYRLVWRPAKRYVPGVQIELHAQCLRAFLAWTCVSFRMADGDITFRWRTDAPPGERFANRAGVLCRAHLPYGARRGEPVEIELTVIPPVWADNPLVLSVWILDTPNPFNPGEPAPPPEKEPGSDCTLTALAGPVERLAVYCRPMPGPDGTVRAVLLPQDRFGNPSAFEQPVPATLTWEGRERPIRLSGRETLGLPAPAGTGRVTVSVPMDGLSPRENIANGQRAQGRLVVTGNPVWAAGAVPGLRAAFGEMHWHTDLSGDGQRPIEAALAAARDDLNMDFAAPGDHNPAGEAWTRTVQAVESCNEDDAFATFFGWENGGDRGHENYYFTEPDHPLACGGSAGITGGRPAPLIEKLAAVYADRPFLAVPHHTNSEAETRTVDTDTPYWHPYPWATPVAYIRLVEIMQCRGNQERNVYDDAWRGWHQNLHASAQDALALGYKLGFTGGTDNHSGWPGRAFAESEGQDRRPLHGVILTGTWTPRVTRQAVFDSLAARHTWAVWDTRAIVWFTVNGALGGDEIAVAAGTPLRAQIRLSAEDALQTLQIVSEGEPVWSASFADRDVETEADLGPAQRSTHFYLRGLLRNGGILYASPVFVTVGPHGE